MRQPRTLAALALATALLASSCGHFGRGPRPLSRSAQRYANEASAITKVAFEEDFLEARLVFQALPLEARERGTLRLRLLRYLLGPIAPLDTNRIRKDPFFFGANDELDRVYDSFRDALDLVAPAELWGRGGGLTAEERALLEGAAMVVIGVFSPRGNELAVATGLYVLATLHPEDPRWRERLDQLFAWIQMGTQLSMAPGNQRFATSVGEVLDTIANSWPAPPVIERLTIVAFERQEKLANVLRRPLGTGTRSALGELLLDSESMQALAVNLAAIYLRCGELTRGAETVERVAGKLGDDPELRQLLANSARSGARPADFLALARRFLPRLELLGGTSNDRVDPVAALEVLRAGIYKHPTDADILVLASRVARFLPAPFLSLRYLEEAQAVLERSRASAQILGDVAAELAELAFSRLRVRIDPEHIELAAREAEALRRQFAESRKRYGDSRFKLRDADIDFELARGFVDAGLIERALPLLQRAGRDGDPSIEVTLQIAKLVLKRGEPGRAAQILREALDRHQQRAAADETIGFVEGQSKLARALGDAQEIAGNADEARRAWSISVRGWERLMVEYLRRKSLAASAEATFEVGRLYYQLGRRADGIQKFIEALEQSDDRDQTYIDALAFLVQQGEIDAALDIFRRAVAKPARAVSEYVKVYASLWIIDITRRGMKVADPSAEAYLRTLDARKVHLRPTRASDWYVPLARYAVGRVTYEQLLTMADTPGKLAEAYFYEAMRRLAEGRNSDAHQLWNKVIETKMFSFFEFDMAARYLRSGAPSEPRPGTADAQTI